MFGIVAEGLGWGGVCVDITIACLGTRGGFPTGGAGVAPAERGGLPTGRESRRQLWVLAKDPFSGQLALCW